MEIIAFYYSFKNRHIQDYVSIYDTQKDTKTKGGKNKCKYLSYNGKLKNYINNDNNKNEAN